MNPITPNNERQAVVIIHGIGEQEPMATLREFAESIIPEIEDDPLGLKKKFYAKPDELSQLFDLRRITVPQDTKKTRQKTDFFEYYWAHQIRDTKASDVIGWSVGIFKHWKFVPKRLKLLHSSILLLMLLIPLLVIALFIFFPSTLQKWQQNWVAFMAAGAGTIYIALKIAGGIAQSISINFIGDAARYLTPKPGNIINRQQIRKDGLELLRKLHGEKQDGTENTPRYSRIIIVAHSLGSVIAYDLLTILWGMYHDELSKLSAAHQAKLLEMQDFVKDMAAKEANQQLTPDELNNFQQIQSELLALSAEAGSPWRVSDLITIGSPLSHAQLLLAKGKTGLEQMQQERLFPTCPPALEAQGTISYTETFNFEGTDTKVKVPHHAALFALTRWTNCWFKNDLVGGPMQQAFGKGIKDIELVSKTHGNIPFLSHTHYWDKKETESVNIIRDIIFKPVQP